MSARPALRRRRSRRLRATHAAEIARRRDHRSGGRAGGNRRDQGGALPRHRRHRHRDQVLAAPAGRLEPQVPDGWRRRVRRSHRQSGAVRRQRRLCDGRYRHRSQRRRHRRELGAEQRGAPDQLRLSRGAPHRGDVEGDHPQLLRRPPDARVLLRLLERRASGADGSAALSRRLRRHRRRRAGGRLHRHRRAVHQGRARAVSGSEEPHAAALARDDAGGGGADSEYVRRARRREGRRDGGSAPVQGRRLDADRAERSADDGAESDLRADTRRRRDGVSGAAVRRRGRSWPDGRHGSRARSGRVSRRRRACAMASAPTCSSTSSSTIPNGTIAPTTCRRGRRTPRRPRRG